jgi:ribosomal protein S18 acetylase RimI-like enzyme
MPPPFTIETATWRDLHTVRQVEKICFPKDMWPIWDIIAVLTLSNIVRLKALNRDRLVGFVAGDIRNSEGLSWIATIAVLPEYRRQGIGRALLAACEERITTPIIRLCVRASNAQAIQLYQNMSYMQQEIWERYYQDGEAAIVMQKNREGGL